VSQTLRYEARKPAIAFPLVLRKPPGHEPLAVQLPGALPPAPRHEPGRRAKIWDLAPNLHCSIIGTCLSTAELRRVLTKAGVAGHDASDHALHSEGVRLAEQRSGAAKLLHKALDERHRLAIRQFERASTEGELSALWRAAKERGDIPGAYWAVLTHPAASDSLIAAAFGDVHMLSHLVGAANRADIRRLRELEADKAGLEAKVLRQQEQLRDAVVSRDAKIRELSGLVARTLAHEPIAPMSREADSAERATLARLVADLERRLDGEARRRRLLEERLAACRRDLLRERDLRIGAERRHAILVQELEAIEAGITGSAASGPAERTACAPEIRGLTILYVGGRPSQVAEARAMIERSGALLLRHDGGVEDNPALLPALIGRANAVVFPVDCVSHAAVSTVKRLCRQADRPYLPLRSGGLGSFLAALRRPEVARLGALVAAE